MVVVLDCDKNFIDLMWPINRKGSVMSGTLFERLGGSEGVRSIVDAVVANHLANPTIKTRYENVEDLDTVGDKVVEFFTVGSGGPGEYTGRSMLDTHRGMNISEEEFLAVVDDTMKAITAHNLSEETYKDVLAILYSLKAEIVRL